MAPLNTMFMFVSTARLNVLLKTTGMSKKPMNPVTQRLYEAIAAAMGKQSVGPTEVAGFLRLASPQVAKNWETRKTGPSASGVVTAAEKGISPRWVNDGVPPMLDSEPQAPITSNEVGEPIDLKRTRRLPVVGEVKGGEDGYLEELQYPTGHGEGFVEYPTSDPNAYALRVRGDSMHPRYRAGEFVIVEPNTEPQEGDDVVVILKNGRKMLKELKWRRAGEFQFTSINNGYAPVTLDAKEVDAIQLVGGRARRSSLHFR